MYRHLQRLSEVSGHAQRGSGRRRRNKFSTLLWGVVRTWTSHKILRYVPFDPDGVPHSVCGSRCRCIAAVPSACMAVVGWTPWPWHMPVRCLSAMRLNCRGYLTPLSRHFIKPVVDLWTRYNVRFSCMYLDVTQLHQNIHQCWCLLKVLVDVPSLPSAAYTLRSSPSLQLGLLTQACRYLETR